MKSNIFRLVFALCLCLSHVAAAGSISITVTATSALIEESGIINLSLQNNGDEAAEDVHLSLMLPEGFDSEPLIVGGLVPGIEWKGAIAVNVTGNILPGTYPAVVLTQYRDANGYQFSSVSKNTIDYKEMTYGDFYGTIKRTELVENAELEVAVNNRGSRPIDAKVSLYLPLEINADEYEKAIHLNARSEDKITTGISNFGALAGSSYYVLAAIEYDDGKHYSYFASGIIDIKPRGEIVGINETWLIALIAALIALFIVYQFRGRIKWKKSQA